ncbi:MAG TPA: heavy-metal-associated domain-containing protein, partial [Candidatus Thermoplasmatota archaeon]|nr:heavy-metal-associated domain-containing protein [Candidatus Thermoplasmatota archaeon]
MELSWTPCFPFVKQRGLGDAATSPSPMASIDQTLRVRGMTCGHCAKTVERAARAVPGVEDARADLGAGALALRA